MKFNKVITTDQAISIAKRLPNIIAIDTEFVKGDPRTTELISIIIGTENEAWVFEPEHIPYIQQFIVTKRVFLQDYNHCDTIILIKHGLDLRASDTHNLIDLHHLINEEASHDLGSRVLSEFSDNYKKEFWGKYSSFEDAPEDEALEYECKDAIYTYRLGVRDIKLVNLQLYNHIRKLSLALLETELSGLRVDVELLNSTEKEVSEQINGFLPKLREEFKYECEIWELKEWQKQIEKRSTQRGKLGVPKPTFSFSSDRQVSWLVYEALGIKPINKTKNGNPSTDSETIKLLAEDEGRLNSLHEYKTVKSLYATFIKGMQERLENGFIYPHFNVSGTNTGRLSHSNPNMGNLPKEGVIRNFFIPREGMVFVGADYSQLEVLIEANLTHDPQLLKIINEGASKHDITSQGLSISRADAKTLNFALQYGAGSKKVAQILNIPFKEAEDVFNRYWELYSGVKALKEATTKTIKETGKLTNQAGRTRHFGRPKNHWEAEKQYRQGYNFLIQGLAAECCNRAFYRIACKVKQYKGSALFSVHDEILLEVPSSAVPQAVIDLEMIMRASTQDFNFKYPLKTTSYGPLLRWSKT